MHCEDLVLIKRPVVIGTPRPLSKHSARNRKTCRTLLVEDVGFLQVLLVNLLATNRRISFCLARLLTLQLAGGTEVGSPGRIRPPTFRLTLVSHAAKSRVLLVPVLWD